MKKTDSDYDLKRQKFIDCDKVINTDKCPEDCSKCKHDIPSEDFIHFLIYGVDEQ